MAACVVIYASTEKSMIKHHMITKDTKIIIGPYTFFKVHVYYIAKEVTFDIFLRSWQSAGSNQSLIDVKNFMDICYRLDKKLRILVAAGFKQGTFEV